MKAKNLANILIGNNKFLSPQKIIDSLGIKEGDRVVDYGAGVGFWAIPLAKAVGKKGKVFALTSNQDFSSLIKRKAELNNINNLETINFELEKGKIKISEKADYVILANVLHLIKDREEAFKRLKALVAKGGKVVIIDFLPVKTLFGPPLNYRVSEEKVIHLAEEVGLKFKCIIETGFHHFGLIFEN